MNERASERVIGRMRLFVYLVVDALLRLTNATHTHTRCRGCFIRKKEKCNIFVCWICCCFDFRMFHCSCIERWKLQTA